MSYSIHETLYRAHSPWLQGWLRARLGTGSERAADFVQETFLRLLQGRRDLASVAEPRPYLATVAKGLLVDYFRRQDLERQVLADVASWPVGFAPSPQDQAIVLETLLAIDRMLDGLGPRVRQAFLLAQLDGLGYAEIAQELSVSVSSVKKYMQKAVVHCLMFQDF